MSPQLRAGRDWAAQGGVELVEPSPFEPSTAHGQPPAAEECDVVLAIGGDGTLLTAQACAARDRVPVLGVSGGNLAALGLVSGPAWRMR